jgi:carbon storage regulator
VQGTGKCAWESDTELWVCLQKGLTAMLVLSRKKNESIVINNDITVTVVEIRGDKVRLGIVAPKEVPVHRQEVYEAIHGKPADTEPNPNNAVAKPVD